MKYITQISRFRVHVHFSTIQSNTIKNINFWDSCLIVSPFLAFSWSSICIYEQYKQVPKLEDNVLRNPSDYHIHVFAATLNDGISATAYENFKQLNISHMIFILSFLFTLRYYNEKKN